MAEKSLYTYAFGLHLIPRGDDTMARILIVDDEDAIRDVLSRILARADHEVEACPDAQSALDLARTWSPDLIITDVYMPEMDGIEFLIQIREERPDQPIIVISGGAERSPADLVLEDAGHLGAVSTLAKPFEMDEVLAAVNAALATPR